MCMKGKGEAKVADSKKGGWERKFCGEEEEWGAWVSRSLDLDECQRRAGHQSKGEKEIEE